MIVFNRKDELQWRFIRRITRSRLTPPVHYIPTSSGFITAASLGLGWCLAPEYLVDAVKQARKIVVVELARWLDVPLYWQQAAIRSSTLHRISNALRDAAAAALRT